MSEAEKKEVNVEAIMEEIRSKIRDRNKTRMDGNIKDLVEARSLVVREIGEKRYCNDLPTFYETPDILPVEIDIEALQNRIQEAMRTGVIGSEFPIEGTRFKRFCKKIFQRMMRCVVIPLTGRITEANITTANCVKQSLQLIERQQKQIEALTAQVDEIRKQMREERS